MSNVRKFFQEAAHTAYEVLTDARDAIDHSATSSIHYGQLLDELKNPLGASLAEKKESAKRACDNHISSLNNTDIVRFYNVLRSSREFAYIRQEQGFHKISGAYGNTATYKYITHLLKQRANENFKRHTTSETRTPQDNAHEIEALKPLMLARCGRMPNLFAKVDLPVGETGKFLMECEKRGGLRR